MKGTVGGGRTGGGRRGTSNSRRKPVKDHQSTKGRE